MTADNEANIHPLKRIALLFSGGPAPSANAVISSAALSFLDHGIEVIGMVEGFSHLESVSSGLVEGQHYLVLDPTISKIRNERGVYIRSSRANPGKAIKCQADLSDPKKREKLKAVVDGLKSLKVDALVTMGGDDTLKTANFIHLMGMPTIHVPKTIDNDYFGIAWTFGFWTAVDAAKVPLLTLKADADSTNAYFLVEMMGRKAGWITYAAGLAAEACAMIAAEEIEGDLDLEALASSLADMIIARDADGRTAGIICIAEGLADKLPESAKPKEIDQHGNVYFGKAELCKTLADRISAIYKERTGRQKKINPKQIGYETRTAAPIAYDTVLASMLGYGAYRLASEGKFGHMVSVRDNFDLVAVPFSELVDPRTLTTKVRMVPSESDFHRLKEALSYPKKMRPVL